MRAGFRATAMDCDEITILPEDVGVVVPKIRFVLNDGDFITQLLGSESFPVCLPYFRHNSSANCPGFSIKMPEFRV